ncbi:MAG: DMT family transporter [Pseudomonadota bacterium]
MISFGWGEFYALASAICWASAVILYKAAGDSLSAHSLNLAKNIVGVSLLIPTAMIIHGLVLPDLSTSEWLILMASGYFGIAIADTWYIKALRVLGAGRIAIVASLYSPFVVLLSILFLGEVLVAWQWVGFLMVLCGITIVVYQRHYSQVDRNLLYRGLGLAAMSVFLTAAGVVAMKPILDNSGFFWLVALRLLAGTIGMFVAIAIQRQWKPFIAEVTKAQHPWHIILPAGIVGTYLALIFWLAGFKYTDATTASVLNETSSVFIVLMAWLFLKEQLSARKIVGVSLTFLGVMVFLGIFTI